MDWIILMWIVGLIFSILFACIGYKVYKKEKQSSRSDFFGTVMLVAVAIVIIIMCLLVHICAYSEAVDLPYRYKAAIKNIDEMEEYLMRYESLSNESLGNLGQGLESLEYKQQIQTAIKDKNELYASICGWLNNWWSPYKDVIISGLPPGDYGIVIVS